MSDSEIIKALEICANRDYDGCEKCPITKTCDGIEFMKGALSLITRQKQEYEELNECYTNLSNASLQHSVDMEKDRKLLAAYQDVFLDLGCGYDVFDPELKEIKAWKDRMIWHCKRCDELLAENERLNALISCKNKLIEGLDASIGYAYDKGIREFAERLKEEFKKAEFSCIDKGYESFFNDFLYNGTGTMIDNLLKEVESETQCPTL